MSHVSNEDFIELAPQASTSGRRASIFDFEDAAPQLQQESGFENVWANFLTFVYSPVTGSKIVDHWPALAQRQLTRLIQNTLASLPSDAAVERLFSVAGDIQRPKRSKLSSKNLSFFGQIQFQRIKFDTFFVNLAILDQR